ncbi:MAG: DUF1788 domain-containing protein [Alphaproteobacteria bacterium]|nr:DUF1788 domain-containing protein [Alphaproteobacteria bacterium]
MPFAIFQYPPEDEFAFREAMRLLTTRLEGRGKRVVAVSLAECLAEALATEDPVEALIEAEELAGIDATVDTINKALADRTPLDALVASRVPAAADPLRHLVFIHRCGALYPVYRPFPLVEQLMGRLAVPAIVFYPGERDGPTSLRFMGRSEPEHNYRPMIF